MDIFINTDKSPALIQAKATGSPLSGFKVKRGAVVPLSVTVLGAQNATGLRMGIKAKGNYEGDLLILAEAAAGAQTELGTRFDLKLIASSLALNDALDVGEGIDTVPASIAAMTEFAWQEGGETYLSDTLQTVIANDIIRLATDAPEAAAGVYPAPDLVATKSWVNGRIATADEVGFVMLGTDETIGGKHVRPVGKTSSGGMAMDVSGLSAYDVAVDNGFVGTESAWLASLKGERGSKGEQGEPGKDADVEAIVNQAVAEVTTQAYEPMHASTAEGTDNAEFYWCEIFAGHIPTGRLTSLALQCRGGAANKMSTSACYLGIWELNDAGEPVLLGVSTNTAVQAVGQNIHWAFDSVPLSGRTLRLCLLPSRDAEWLSGDLCFGARVSPCSDSCCMVMTSPQSYLPQVVFSYDSPLPRFAPASHVSDTELHLSASERAGLAQLLARKDELLALLS